MDPSQQFISGIPQWFLEQVGTKIFNDLADILLTLVGIKSRPLTERKLKDILDDYFERVDSLKQNEIISKLDESLLSKLYGALEELQVLSITKHKQELAKRASSKFSDIANLQGQGKVGNFSTMELRSVASVGMAIAHLMLDDSDEELIRYYITKAIINDFPTAETWFGKQALEQLKPFMKESSSDISAKTIPSPRQTTTPTQIESIAGAVKQAKEDQQQKKPSQTDLLPSRVSGTTPKQVERSVRPLAGPDNVQDREQQKQENGSKIQKTLEQADKTDKPSLMPQAVPAPAPPTKGNRVRPWLIMGGIIIAAILAVVIAVNSGNNYSSYYGEMTQKLDIEIGQNGGYAQVTSISNCTADADQQNSEGGTIVTCDYTTEELYGYTGNGQAQFLVMSDGTAYVVSP